MSNVEKHESTEVAIPEGLAGVGLEDIDQSDLQTPRLKINHNVGTFVLYGEEYTTLDVILLGMLKQRTLWQPGTPEEGATPICRSWDFKVGHPNSDKWSEDYMRVTPADESGFGPVADGEELACEDCRLKEFGTDPKGGRAPWCTEQHVYPLLIVQDTGYQPSILTLQKTSLKASRTYVQPFFVNRAPLFTVKTRLSLDLAKHGGNTYSVVNLKRVEQTAQSNWDEWGNAFRTLKAMLQTPRTEVVEGTDDTPVAAPARKAKEAAVEVDESSLWDEDNEG